MPKNKLKNFISGIIIISLLFCGATVFAATATKTIQVSSNVSIYTDGVKLDPKDGNGNPVDAFIYNGTTYLPAKAIGEAYRKDIKWEAATRSVYIGETTDNIRPAVTLNPSASDATEGGSLDIVYTTIDNVEVVNVDLTEGDIVLKGFTATKSIEGDTIKLTNIRGDVGIKTVTVNGGIAMDASGNLNDSVLTAFTLHKAGADIVNPVVNISNPSVSEVVEGGSVSYTITPTDNVKVAVMSLNGRITPNGFTADINISGNVVTLSNIQGSTGAKSITVGASAVTDTSGNTNFAKTSPTFNIVKK